MGALMACLHTYSTTVSATGMVIANVDFTPAAKAGIKEMSAGIIEWQDREWVKKQLKTINPKGKGRKMIDLLRCLHHRGYVSAEWALH
jgi:hypothetical protein